MRNRYRKSELLRARECYQDWMPDDMAKCWIAGEASAKMTPRHLLRAFPTPTKAASAMGMECAAAWIEGYKHGAMAQEGA